MPCFAKDEDLEQLEAKRPASVSFGALEKLFRSVIIGIKHGFSCINIRQVPREVLKNEAGGHGFQHLPRDLANVNALKTMFDHYF